MIGIVTTPSGTLQYWSELSMCSALQAEHSDLFSLLLLFLSYGKKGPGRSFHYEIAGDFPLFYSTLAFGDDLICVQNWMGMVSFLSSPVLGTFWLKKVKRMHIEGCLF